MIRPTRLLIAAAAAALASATLLAADVTVKLATIVPLNSLWYSALTDMGAAWKTGTQNRVSLVIYPGGKLAPDEPGSIKLMRPEMDQVNAAMLTTPGLATIDDAFNVFGIPFFLASEEEARAVRDAITPALSAKLEAKGYHFVNWGHGGWVQLFSRNEIRSIDALKKAKLFTSQGDDRMVRWYTKNGFNPQPTKALDMATNLGTGLIEAAPSPAYAAAMIQIYRSANYMLDLRLGPLYGGVIVTDRVWKNISDADRAKVLAAGQAMQKQLDTTVPAQDEKAIADMKARNPKFTVTKLTDKELQAFRAEGERLAPTLRTDGIVPGDIYDLAVAARDAFRKKAK